jgi:hypothetical protein
MTRLLALSALILVTAAASGASAATNGVSACKGSQLAGTFRAIPGSAGAGNIVYALLLKNVSSSTCRVNGLPHGTLLGKTGKALPTHVVPAFKGALTAVLITLAPGRQARATARFSPDVPGPGEPVTARQCEATSYWFRLAAPGGGTAKVKLAPATPVCEHGRLQFSAYGRPPKK